VPGAGSDLGGRGAGGQPQRQRGMTQIVGAAHRLGASPVLPHGYGAGLVPDPAVEAFAERAAAGAPEQPPICGAPEGPQVPAQEAGKLQGDRAVPAGRLFGLLELPGDNYWLDMVGATASTGIPPKTITGWLARGGPVRNPPPGSVTTPLPAVLAREGDHIVAYQRTNRSRSARSGQITPVIGCGEDRAGQPTVQVTRFSLKVTPSAQLGGLVRVGSAEAGSESQ
jgi:hypothetical protein